jgi:hypothetical protein
MIHETKGVSPASATGTNGFDLKHVTVDLLPASGPSQRSAVALADLEALRTGRRAVPASKHGLETICGASCEIGAQ